MPRQINLRQIEAFKAVMENGTVSRAALLLNISQPAISKSIAHLEYDTGLRLFDRVKGRLAPTEQAMRLYEEVGRIFAGVQQVENAVEAIRREEQGRLSVGVMPALSGPFVQRVTTTFLQERKSVYCYVETLNSQWVVDRLIARKLDVGLVAATIENPYVTREPLMRHPVVCIMPPGHPLAEKTVIEPQDLDEVPFVEIDKDIDLGNIVAAMFETYRIRPKIVIGSNVAQTICEFVAAGHGVSLVHPLSLTGFEHRIIARRFEPELHYAFQLCRSADSKNLQLIDAFAHSAEMTAAKISEAIFAST